MSRDAPGAPGGPGGGSVLARAVEEAGRLQGSDGREVGEGELIRVMGFASGERWFAIDVAAVAEIVPRGTVVPMPRTPPHVLGVTAYRGQVIAVIDLVRLLGGAGATPSAADPRLVVLQGEGCRLAVPARAVTDVLELAPSALHPSPAGPSSERDPIDGCVEAEGSLLSRLRMDRLVERVAVAGG